MRVVYAGSFDPFHAGHLHVVEQAALAFDEVVVAVVVNPNKTATSAPESRTAQLAEDVRRLDNVDVVAWEGLTADLARSLDADVLIRGAARDGRTELAMAHMNAAGGGIPTIFVPADERTAGLSSTLLRAAAAAAIKA